MRFALDLMVEKGFVPLSVPTLVRPQAMIGTGYFPGGEEQAYRTDERDDLCLVGTAEVPVTALHMDEILPLGELPMLFVAWSTCYRREAGTYGKDTKGLYRVHQFQKVEQVVIDVADPAKSVEHHRSILRNSQELLESLELAYRVVNVCGGDLGQPQIQKFDIETWMPSREGYGETHIASRFHDFQARRLTCATVPEGKVQFCHTLNTVAASARIRLPAPREPPGATAASGSRPRYGATWAGERIGRASTGSVGPRDQWPRGRFLLPRAPTASRSGGRA